jgi:hypothetical protein
MRTKRSGVYSLVIGPYFYVGSTTDLDQRVFSHRCELRAGRHSPKLQRAWYEYQSAELHVLVECSKEELLVNEQIAIDWVFATEFCLNTGRCAENPNRGRKLSAERCAQIGEARRGKKHTPESIAKMASAKLGRPRSLETRAKISASLKRRYAQQSNVLNTCEVK